MSIALYVVVLVLLFFLFYFFTLIVGLRNVASASLSEDKKINFKRKYMGIFRDRTLSRKIRFSAIGYLFSIYIQSGWLPIILIALVTTLFSFLPNNHLYDRWMIIIAWELLLVFVIMNFSIKQKFKNALVSFLFSIFAMFLICIAVNNYINYMKVADGKPFALVTFKFKEKQFSSDELVCYIGETRSYIFLYDLKIKKTSVYLKSDLNELNYIKGYPRNFGL
ncbi:hypothetical protein CH378_18130 [Leptospira kmetyi]|uniref:ABC transporter permease n=2 Tax=Leptospira kmetyi TaxID=408139 RepID=A0ABX4N505_9LEPT|nr:hypothetical protein CH378_18130 [Leptospira kmetyi]